MRFFATALLLATTLTISIAKPVPSSLDEIERRWSEGETEQSIHAAHTHRDATPSWPIVRESLADIEGDAFSYSPDERTMFSHQKRSGESLLSKMKQFVEHFYRSRGEKGVIGREREVEEAPVLKPKKGMRYQFVA